MHDDQFGRLRRSLGDRKQRTHTQRFHLFAFENLALEAVIAGHLLRRLRQIAGGADVARQIAQRSGQRDAGGDAQSLGQRFGRRQFAALLDDQRQLAQRDARRVLFAFELLETIEAFLARRLPPV